jgi:hypothetical protein
MRVKATMATVMAAVAVIVLWSKLLDAIEPSISRGLLPRISERNLRSSLAVAWWFSLGIDLICLAFWFEDMDDLTTGHGDGFDGWFEGRGRGFSIDFQVHLPLPDRALAEHLLQCGSEGGWGDRLAIEMQFVVGVDRDGGDRCIGLHDLVGDGGLPRDVVVVLGAREDDEKDEQEKCDIAHRH